MKNLIKFIILIGTVSFLFIGCSSNKSEKTIDNFINKLLSVGTYENITFLDDEYNDNDTSPGVGISESNESLDKYAEELKKNFGEYFTEKGFDNTMSNLVPHLYYTVIHDNDVKEISDIKIKKLKESENDTYKAYEFTHYEYEVSYKLKSDSKSLDMVDYMTFKVMKNNPSVIEEVSIVNEKSSVFNKFKNNNSN